MIQLNFKKFQTMLVQAIKNIVDQVEYINNLNVFPVPDGDTGLNLKQTLSKALIEVQKKDYKQINDFAQMFARETLMNARGNSGIIISRIIKGLTNPLKNCVDHISIDHLINAFKDSYQFCYTAVQNPTEGTMLTVTRFIHEALTDKYQTIETIEQLLLIVYDAAANAVIQSPNLLPVLKENNAIDSGAFAVLQFYKGFLEANEINIPEYNLFQELNLTSKKAQQKVMLKQKFINFEEKSDFGYCCEFIVSLGAKIAPNQKSKLNYNYQKIVADLDKFNAQSVVIVQEDQILKIHAHLINPDVLLKIGQKYGEFISVKIENMNLQFQDHANENIKKFESSDFVTDKKNALYAILPTTKLKLFAKERFGLNYFWDLEAQGKPNNKNLVEEIYETKAQKVYVLTSNLQERKKFQVIEKLINPKQELSIVKTTALIHVLSLLSFYEKRKANWWNQKFFHHYLKNFSHIFVTIKQYDQNETTMVLHNGRKIVLESDNLKIIANKMIEQFFSIRTWLTKFNLIIIYNNNQVADIIKHVKQIVEKETKINDVYGFCVKSEKNLITIGIIKCN
ncbi:Dihydroxyacetone kinase-like protein, DhaL domain-containing protein [[Mycoplasma] cavipharyngis]|uniref:DAK2 domain-containing protein n=1 Tax=[Mycoplasma] cavipharyngis TaxID=92757 RepID=UPI0037042EB5